MQQITPSSLFMIDWKRFTAVCLPSYVTNRLSPLAHFFKNKIVLETVERDTNDILLMELNPGVSKKGLYKEHAYLHD